MNIDTLNAAVEEALRFIAKAQVLQEQANVTNHFYETSVVDRGWVRRSSMDLTRALAILRKSS